MKKIVGLLMALIIISGVSVFAVAGTSSNHSGKLNENSQTQTIIPNISEKSYTTSNQEQSKQEEEANENELGAIDVPTSFVSTQDEIIYKMLNSMDHFTTASVEFSTIFPGSDVEENYFIETNLNTGISHQISSDNNIVQTRGSEINKAEAYETYSDGTLVRRYNNLERTVQVLYEVEKRETLEEEWPDNKERYYIDENGDPHYRYRGNPTNAGMAGECLLPQVSAFAYLMDKSLWSVVDTIQYCGRNCYSIEGIVNDSYSAQIGAETFMMYVDTETGILLKLEACDANGDVVSSMVVSEISIDAPMTRNAFEYDMSKYEDYTELPSLIGPQP